MNETRKKLRCPHQSPRSSTLSLSRGVTYFIHDRVGCFHRGRERGLAIHEEGREIVTNITFFLSAPFPPPGLLSSFVEDDANKPTHQRHVRQARRPPLPPPDQRYLFVSSRYDLEAHNNPYMRHTKSEMFLRAVPHLSLPSSGNIRGNINKHHVRFFSSSAPI